MFICLNGNLHSFSAIGHPNVGVMTMTNKEYQQLINRLSPKSPVWKDCFNAFWIGGLICVLGQLAMNGYLALENMKTENY